MKAAQAIEILNISRSTLDNNYLSSNSVYARPKL